MTMGLIQMKESVPLLKCQSGVTQNLDVVRAGAEPQSARVRCRWRIRIWPAAYCHRCRKIQIEICRVAGVLKEDVGLQLAALWNGDLVPVGAT
jgi:hypothetical protein